MEGGEIKDLLPPLPGLMAAAGAPVPNLQRDRGFRIVVTADSIRRDRFSVSIGRVSGQGLPVKCSRDTLNRFWPQSVDADMVTAHAKGRRTNPAEVRGAAVTLMLLWQEYSAANAGAFAYQYSQFADLYRQCVATLRRSMRKVHRASEKLF